MTKENARKKAIKTGRKTLWYTKEYGWLAATNLSNTPFYAEIIEELSQTPNYTIEDFNKDKTKHRDIDPDILNLGK